MFVHAVPEFMLKKLLTRLGGMRRHSHVILALFLEFLVAGFTLGSENRNATHLSPVHCTVRLQTDVLNLFRAACDPLFPTLQRHVRRLRAPGQLAHGFCCVASLFCFSIT